MTSQSDVLKLLKTGMTTGELATALGMREESVRKALNRLIKKGLVKATGTTTDRCFGAVQLGTTRDKKDVPSDVPSPTTALLGIKDNVPSANSTNKMEATPSSSNPISRDWRLHRNELEAQHTGIPQDMEALDFRKVPDFNSPYYIKEQDGYVWRVYNNVLILKGPEYKEPIDSTAACTLRRKAEEDLYLYLFANIAPQKLNLCKLGNVYLTKMLNCEIAQTDNLMAKKVLEPSKPTYIVLTYERGIPRIIADMSDLKELEAVLVQYSGIDSDRLKSMLDDMGAGGIDQFYKECGLAGVKALVTDQVKDTGWDLMKARQDATDHELDGVHEVLHSLVENQAVFASNNKSHALLIKRLSWMMPAALIIMIAMFTLSILIR